MDLNNEFKIIMYCGEVGYEVIFCFEKGKILVNVGKILMDKFFFFFIYN